MTKDLRLRRAWRQRRRRTGEGIPLVVDSGWLRFAVERRRIDHWVHASGLIVALVAST
jgi:hypothetical protein